MGLAIADTKLVSAMPVVLEAEEAEALGEFTLSLQPSIKESFKNDVFVPDNLAPIMAIYAQALIKTSIVGSTFYRIFCLETAVTINLDGKSVTFPNGKELIVFLLIDRLLFSMYSFKSSFSLAQGLFEKGLFQDADYFATIVTMLTIFPEPENCKIFIQTLEQATPQAFLAFFKPIVINKIASILQSLFSDQPPAQGVLRKAVGTILGGGWRLMGFGKPNS